MNQFPGIPDRIRMLMLLASSTYGRAGWRTVVVPDSLDGPISNMFRLGLSSGTRNGAELPVERIRLVSD